MHRLRRKTAWVPIVDGLMLLRSLAVHLALCVVINSEKHTVGTETSNADLLAYRALIKALAHLSFEKLGWANVDSIEYTARPVKWFPAQILTTPDPVRIVEV